MRSERRRFNDVSTKSRRCAGRLSSPTKIRFFRPPRPSSSRLPVMQNSNGSVAFSFSIIPFVRCHQQRVLRLERNGVIQRVKQMVIDL